MPLTEKRNIFLEDTDMKTRGLQAELKAITALPEYEVTIQAAATAANSKSRHENNSPSLPVLCILYNHFRESR